MSAIDYRRVSLTVRVPALNAQTLILGAAALSYALMNVAIVVGAGDCVAGTDSLLCRIAQVVVQ
jgi:hypothetical protein